MIPAPFLAAAMVPETWLPCLSLSLLSAPVVLKASPAFQAWLPS